MHREIIWRSDDGIGAEYLLLSETESGIVADSVVFASRDAEPSRTSYRAEMDLEWHIRSISVTVEQAGETERILELRSDGTGHWRDGDGQSLPQFDGCLDIDISATPFTNTLPIRRLRLQPGQVEPITVLFIHVPTLRIEPWDQRYTGLTDDTVRYESVGTDFRRELTIDGDGLVVDYPGLFQRVWSR
ncbi:MAG: putative glycolipid-binding domain-containing protein [Thermomicrobiales bacterium]